MKRRISSDVWTMNDPRYTLKQWWLGEGQYDFALFDALAHGLADASPDGLIFPRIKIDPPKSWQIAHPGEMRQNKPRPDSKAWRALYRRMLRDMRLSAVPDPVFRRCAPAMILG